MDAYEPMALADDQETRQRLRAVTTLCVESLLLRGVDARTIRRTVLLFAIKAIEDLAVDAYEEEAHAAVVRQTIDRILEPDRVDP